MCHFNSSWCNSDIGYEPNLRRRADISIPCGSVTIWHGEDPKPSMENLRVVKCDIGDEYKYVILVWFCQ